jgi:hypothetical protein
VSISLLLGRSLSFSVLTPLHGEGADEAIAIRIESLADLAHLLATFEVAGRVAVVAAPGDDPAEVDALHRACEGVGVH